MLIRIQKAHDAVSELGLWLGIAALAAIAALSFVATMSRYFLGAPIGWVPDWTGYLLAASVFVTAPAVTGRGQHVAMDILVSLFSGARMRAAIGAVAALATLLILACMSWIVFAALTSAWRAGTLTAAGYPIPRWWLLAVVFYGFLSSGLHVLRLLLGLVFGPVFGRSVPAAQPSATEGA